MNPAAPPHPASVLSVRPSPVQCRPLPSKTSSGLSASRTRSSQASSSSGPAAAMRSLTVLDSGPNRRSMIRVRPRSKTSSGLSASRTRYTSQPAPAKVEPGIDQPGSQGGVAGHLPDRQRRGIAQDEPFALPRGSGQSRRTRAPMAPAASASRRPPGTGSRGAFNGSWRTTDEPGGSAASGFRPIGPALIRVRISALPIELIGDAVPHRTGQRAEPALHDPRQAFCLAEFRPLPCRVPGPLPCRVPSMLPQSCPS